MKVIMSLLALCVYASVCGAARPLTDIPARRSALRGLSQYFVDDQRLTGTNIFANQHFSRMRLPAARDLINTNAQIEASTPDGDKSYLIDSQATMVIKRQDYDSTKDLLNQQVESATRNAPDKGGDASNPNTVAGSTTSIWTTAVMKPSETIRASMAGDIVQGAISIAVDDKTGKDTPRAAKTGAEHFAAVVTPTGYFNWRR